MPVVPQSFANLHFVLNKGCNILLAKTTQVDAGGFFSLSEYLKLLSPNQKLFLWVEKIVKRRNNLIPAGCRKSSIFIYVVSI